MNNLFNSFKGASDEVGRIAVRACNTITDDAPVPEDYLVDTYNVMSIMWSGGFLPDSIMLNMADLFDPAWSVYVTCIINTLKAGGLGV